MQRLKVRGAIRLIYRSLGVKGFTRVKETRNIVHATKREEGLLDWSQLTQKVPAKARY